jgi:hypothetical protein
MSLWLAIAAVGVVAWVWYARRKPGVLNTGRWRFSLFLMLAAFAAVMAVLLNPTWSSELPPPPGKPVLTVLVDASASMATPDSGGGKSRFAAAAGVADEVKQTLSQHFDVRIKAFDQTTRLADLTAEPAGRSTDLAGAVATSAAEESAAGQAVVLLSDGIHNAGGGSSQVLDAVRVARAMDMPVYTRTFGGEVKTIDLAVQLRSSQDLAVAGQKLPVTVRVNHTGLSGSRANVVLYKDGKETARREAQFAAGGNSGSADVHFLVTHDNVGVYPYEVRVDPISGEASQANNSAAYVLRVVDEPIRVLVLEGKPYWDSKFFTRTLTSDPAIALDSVTMLTDKRLMRRVLSHESKASTQPANRSESWQIETDAKTYLEHPDRLRGYQVLVLGRDVEAFLSEQAIANLADWVANDGGSLVCYRGSPTAASNQLLVKLLPVKWTPASAKETRFRLNLTDRGQDMEWLPTATDGQRSPAALAGMPSLAMATVIDSARPLAVVLAQSTSADGSRTPAVVYQPYGSGRVAVIEGSGMWRWAFLAPQYQQQESVYTSLWHSLMRWLTSGANLQPGQKFSLRADKIRFGAAEPATVTLLAREESGAAKMPAVELTLDGAKDSKSFQPAAIGDEAGVFRVNFGQLAEGRYHAKLAGGSEKDTATQVIFDVVKTDQEQLDLQARPDLMARIAADSGGAVLTDASLGEVAKMFQQHRAKSHPPTIVRQAAWDRWWILAAVLGLWAMSWFVRRSGGLV